MIATELRRQQLIDDIQALPADVLQEAADFIARLRLKKTEEVEKSTLKANLETSIEYSPYEDLKDLIGCGEGPAALSTNHKTYLEGFGS